MFGNFLLLYTIFYSKCTLKSIWQPGPQGELTALPQALYLDFSRALCGRECEGREVGKRQGGGNGGIIPPTTNSSILDWSAWSIGPECVLLEI